MHGHVEIKYFLLLERSTLQLRNRKFKQKELEEEEQERQKKIKIIEQNELFAKMVINIEEEIKVIDRECAILKVDFYNRLIN